MENEIVEFSTPKTREEEYVEYCRIVHDFTSEENAKLDLLTTTTQKAEYVKSVLDERNNQVFADKANEHKRQANFMFVGILLYLIAVFPMSYVIINKVSLDIFPALGAFILAIIITAILIVLLVIRKFVMEYHDIKAHTAGMMNKRLFGELTIRDTLTLAIVLIAFFSVGSYVI